MLADHVNAYDPASVLRLHSLQQYFVTKGYSTGVAGQQALSVVQRTVLAQASIMSYQDAFVLMGLVFLAAMPLLLLFEKRSPLQGRRPAAPVGE